MTIDTKAARTAPADRSAARRSHWGRRALMGTALVLLGLGLAGCGARLPVYKISLETKEVPRRDDVLEGNRGYLVGEPPEPSERPQPEPAVRKITTLKVTKGEPIRFEPWKAILALDRWIREHMW